MTYRQLTKLEQLDAVERARDWFEERAAYLRRRADSPGERSDMLVFEDMARQLADVASNLNAEQKSDARAEADEAKA